MGELGCFFLHFHLTRGCVHLDFCFICESFYIIENILQILKLFLEEPRELFTEVIKNISSFDPLFCGVLVLNQTLESSIKIVSKFNNHRYIF